jgi:hypothetical protein
LKQSKYISALQHTFSIQIGSRWQKTSVRESDAWLFCISTKSGALCIGRQAEDISALQNISSTELVSQLHIASVAQIPSALFSLSEAVDISAKWLESSQPKIYDSDTSS